MYAEDVKTPSVTSNALSSNTFICTQGLWTGALHGTMMSHTSMVLARTCLVCNVLLCTYLYVVALGVFPICLN